MLNINNYFDWKYYINKHNLKKNNIKNKIGALNHWNNIGKTQNFIFRYKKNNIIYYPIHFSDTYDFSPNNYYVISNEITIKNKKSYFSDNINLFILNGNRIKDILITIHSKNYINNVSHSNFKINENV